MYYFQIEEEKERLNQTLPVHWTTKLGSLPDLSIPDLPISSSTQEISIEPNQSDDQPVARVRTIKSKPLEGGKYEDETLILCISFVMVGSGYNLKLPHFNEK